MDTESSIYYRYLKLFLQKKETHKLLKLLPRLFKTQKSKGLASAYALRLKLGIVATTAIATGFVSPVYAAGFFIPGDLIVSGSTYAGDASTVTIGQTLPSSNKPAIANGAYPDVFNNATPDSSFGVTSPTAIPNSERFYAVSAIA